MPKPLSSRQLSFGDSFILYDEAFLVDPELAFFDPDYWRSQGDVTPVFAGRGSAFFFQYEKNDCVLRHYCRGGLVRYFSKDRYFWTGLDNTRAWREWFLLAQLQQQGLPVPRPLAAMVRRKGLWYRADLIIERFLNVKTLSVAAVQAMPNECWQAIGVCVRRFHDAGVYHADLNAHNILLGKGGEVYLIDFDRGELRAPEWVWQSANLERLKRSLVKLKSQGVITGFNEAAWSALLEGYGG